MAERKSIFSWQLFLGFILVISGGLFLADQFIAVNLMRNYWPLLVVFLGLIFFIGMILAGKRGSGLAIPGAVITVAGIIFYIHNTFNLWITWTYAWSLLISAVGFGMLILNIYLKRDGLRKAAGWVIGGGLILFVIFGIFFEVILDLAGANINSGVFLGSGLVLLGLFVVFSRWIFSDKKKETPPEEGAEKPFKEPLEAPDESDSEDIPSEAVEATSEGSKETISPFSEEMVFTKLDFKGAGKVFLQQGEACSLRIEGDQELIDKVETDVVDGILKITFLSDEKGLKRMKSIGQQSQLEYFVTVNELEGLKLSGAGNIQADQLQGGSLEIVHSGEGQLILKGLQYQEIQTALEGLGEIELAGEVEVQDLDLSGLGTYKAENLKSQDANITVSGAGSGRVWVERELNATLTGAGNIRYKGQPELEKSVSGLGSIEPLEVA